MCCEELVGRCQQGIVLTPFLKLISSIIHHPSTHHLIVTLSARLHPILAPFCSLPPSGVCMVAVPLHRLQHPLQRESVVAGISSCTGQFAGQYNVCWAIHCVLNPKPLLFDAPGTDVTAEQSAPRPPSIELQRTACIALGCIALHCYLRPHLFLTHGFRCRAPT